MLCPHATAVIDDAELLVSEVVTNAVSYAGSPIAIRIECAETVLHIAVHDGAEGLHPQVRGSHDETERLADGEIDLDEHGRGLAFVVALAQDLTIEPDELGKTVSFSLALS